MSVLPLSPPCPNHRKTPYFVHFRDKCDHVEAAEVRTWGIHLATSPFASVTVNLTA